MEKKKSLAGLDVLKLTFQADKRERNSVRSGILGYDVSNLFFQCLNASGCLRFKSRLKFITERRSTSESHNVKE